MRKTRSLLIAFLAFAAAAAAGAGDPERGTMHHKWAVEAAYPRFGDKKLDNAIQAWLDQTVTEIMDDAGHGASAAVGEGSFDVGIDYEVTSPSREVASVAFFIVTSPSGAAHPMTAVAVRNYFHGSDRPLDLDDLFADPEKAVEILASRAKPMVKDYLKANFPDVFADDSFTMLDEEWFCDGSSPSRHNYANLSLEPGGVRVRFQKYQVLPYVFGLIDYFVPLEALEPAGPSEKIWPRAKG